jgi:hypothetical protein
MLFGSDLTEKLHKYGNSDETELISLYEKPDKDKLDEDSSAQEEASEELRKAEEMLTGDESSKKRISLRESNGVLKGGYVGKSIYFYAMCRTIEEGKFFTVPTLLAIMCSLGQVLVLNGILFKNFVAVIPNMNTWGDLSKMPALDQEKIGFLVGLIISPMILLAKLISNGEFLDIAVFAATYRTYMKHVFAKASPNRWVGVKTKLILSFWLFIHTVRTFYLVPMFIFVNAKLMADVNSIMAVLTTNVGLSFLFDLDNDLFSAIYADDEDAHEVCTKDIGFATKLKCDEFKTRFAQVIFAVQMLMVIRFKTAESLLDLWYVPLTSVFLIATQFVIFPAGGKKTQRFRIATVVGWLFVYLLWIAFHHCYLFPTEMGFAAPEHCNPYVDPFYFHPNVTKSTNTLGSKLGSPAVAG